MYLESKFLVFSSTKSRELSLDLDLDLRSRFRSLYYLDLIDSAYN